MKGSAPKSVEPATHVKSTLIASSRSALATHELLDAYEEKMTAEQAFSLREASMLNTWIPMELARVHYLACDSLDLDESLVTELGNAVAVRIASPFFGTLIRLARGGGITPWTPLSRVSKAWGRAYMGSTISVREIERKDAELRILGNELGAIPYWVNALGSLMKGTTEMFARKAYCHPVRSSATEVRYRISWA